MSEPLKKRLVQELLCIADSKWVLGHWYIMVMRNGRSLSDFNALAGMSQDELGQTRALFRFIEEAFDEPVNRLEFERDADEISDMALLDLPPTDWADFVCTSYLAEAALWQFLATFQNSDYRPVANFVRQFGQETNFHLRYGLGWLKAFNDDDRRAIDSAILRRLPAALTWFGKPQKAVDDPLLAAGLRTKSVGDARNAFLEKNVAPLCQGTGVGSAQVDAILKTLSWTNWDEARRRARGSTMPAQLWEFVLPTNNAAVFARRALQVSKDDNLLWTEGSQPQ
jgi:ring-1,2-phenylacetyl-CoA epoxidase subunit PaaC